MFRETEWFNIDLRSWNVQKVTDIGGIFWRAHSFSQKLCWDLNEEKVKSERILDASIGFEGNYPDCLGDNDIDEEL